MIIFKIVIAIFFIIFATAIESYRRLEDGIKSAGYYGLIVSIHDIQEHLGKLGFIQCGLTVFACCIIISNNPIDIVFATIVSIIIAYSSSIIGNYYFQAKVNSAFGLPKVDPHEKKTWFSPKRDKHIKKFWYGERRKYQRQIGCLLILISLLFYILWIVL